MIHHHLLCETCPGFSLSSDFLANAWPQKSEQQKSQNMEFIKNWKHCNRGTV